MHPVEAVLPGYLLFVSQFYPFGSSFINLVLANLIGTTEDGGSHGGKTLLQFLDLSFQQYQLRSTLITSR